ncbi:DUF2158 domain-containing protein [Botryobacter ruber]|uniref:DUF2158 domain-containing protein n=1 Tax=Botryobacter ruber TaxID=2171629 RepID=UPI000E09F05A|nr:DUF2158 domain-containing protein [Botryobacter ruber]
MAQDNKFKTGDIVKVKGIRSPNMIVKVYSPIGTHLEPAYICSWFDNEQRIQEGTFHEETLEKVT